MKNKITIAPVLIGLTATVLVKSLVEPVKQTEQTRISETDQHK